ncbi:hypothetical protein LINGRAHAP2_LOCUS19661 [Linum grandiflorum]
MHQHRRAEPGNLHPCNCWCHELCRQ